jgi:SagB-type dehydrogenase family enzyme
MTVLFTLQPDVELSAVEPDTITVRDSARGGMKLTGLPAGVWAALRSVAERPLDRERLGLSPDELARVDVELTRLMRWGLVRMSCVAGGAAVMTATLTSELATLEIEAPGADTPLRLSRFAYARRSERDLVIESPRSYARATVHRPELAGLLVALSDPATINQLRIPGLADEIVGDCVRLLICVGIVGIADAEDADPEVVQREFHEVLAHWWSRTGLIDRPVGAVLPFQGRIAPSPAVKRLSSARIVALPKPDVDGLLEHDPPLAKVMEERRSVRQHGDDPITIGQLGEFLFRVARVRAVLPIDVANGQPYEISDRTYPSAGAAYDLELYLTVWTCAGVPPGIYHYDPVGHALSLVCDRTRLFVGMLRDAGRASGTDTAPQVLITLASRFNRLNWKYRGLSYVTTLKNVGVLYEAMYLAATAMGLAPCGLGGGNSATFCRATGLDPLVESSVGEFTLGTTGRGKP